MEDRIKGYLMCFFGVFTWSFSEITVKLLHGAAGPVSLSFHRFFFGGLFLIAMLPLQRQFRQDLKDLWLMAKRSIGLFILSSMIGLGVSNILYFLGLQLTQANIGAALYTTYPLFISIYSIFILNERSNLPLKFLGYTIGFIGTFILLTNFQFDLLLNPQNITGNILLVTSAAIWGMYSVLGKKIMRREKAMLGVEIKFTIVGFFAACLVVFPVLVFTPEWGTTFFHYDLRAWLLIMFLACFSTGFGLYIFFVGLRKIEVTQGMSLSLLKPVMVTIFAYFILGEIPSIALIITICLVSIAVLLINRPPKKEIINA
jgi:drug/metabolite transporter (DMT)-like permease